MSRDRLGDGIQRHHDASAGRVSDGRHPLTVEVVEVGSLPTLSAESRARLDAIRARGASLRRLYRTVVLLMALAITGLTFVGGLRLSPHHPGESANR
jgi:hypothetical protein